MAACPRKILSDVLEINRQKIGFRTKNNFLFQMLTLYADYAGSATSFSHFEKFHLLSELPIHSGVL